MKILISLIILALAILLSCYPKDNNAKETITHSSDSENEKIILQKTESDSPSINFDSLINSLEQNKIKTFKINDFFIEDTTSLVEINQELFLQIYNDISDYDPAAKEYLLSKIRSTDSSHLFLTFSTTTQGENTDGTPYLVNSIILYCTKNNGKLIDKITLATEDNAVFTFEIDSYLNKDNLMVNQRFFKEGDNEADTMYFKTVNFLISQNNNDIDTVSVATSFKLIKN